MKGEGREQQGGRVEREARRLSVKGFVMVPTRLHLLRVYCKSRPQSTEGKGRGGRLDQGTSNKPKTVSISDGTPPTDDRVPPADRKTTGQRRFWK